MTQFEKTLKQQDELNSILETIKNNIENEADNFITEHKENIQDYTDEQKQFMYNRYKELQNDTKKQLKKLKEIKEFLTMYLLV